jgi:hypothetical protein
MVFDAKEKNTASRLRSLYDLIMGILWTAVGFFFLFQKKFGYDFELAPALNTIFGVSSLLYGLFRIYRGFKKN